MQRQEPRASSRYYDGDLPVAAVSNENLRHDGDYDEWRIIVLSFRDAALPLFIK